MVGVFALSSPGDETPRTGEEAPELQLTKEKQSPLRDVKGRFYERNPLEVETLIWTTGPMG